MDGDFNDDGGNRYENVSENDDVALLVGRTTPNGKWKRLATMMI